MNKLISKVLMSAVVLAFGASIAVAQDGWVKLGEKDVDFRTDHDQIAVDDKGTIREIRMSVQYSSITFDRIVIRYKNGKRQEVPYANLVQVDQFSPAVSLLGDGGAIKDLDVWYSTDGMTGKKAKVTFFGRSGGGRDHTSMPAAGHTTHSMSSPGEGWKRIAEKDVDFSLDHERIDVDDSGIFNEVRMSVNYSPVRFDRIVIHYKNGKRQEVPYANLIEADQFSPAVTLTGDGGAIEDIEVWYLTEGMSGKKAKVTYYARSAMRAPITAGLGGMTTAPLNKEWKRIAEKDVNFSLDRDKIDVDDSGTFREVRMSVSYSPVRFERIVIRYKNGKTQEVPFANLIEVDQFSPAVTLTGDGGVIEDIDVWYSTEGMSGKKAKVTYYGRM